jgi:hypothetical protein
MVMAGTFHSRFDLDALTDDGKQAFRTAMRLAAEKRGQVWIAEGGDVVAALILTERLADMAADHLGQQQR